MRDTVLLYCQSLSTGDYETAAKLIDPQHRSEFWQAMRDAQRALKSIGEERGLQALLDLDRDFPDLDDLAPTEFVRDFFASTIGKPTEWSFKVDTVSEIGPGRGLAVYSVAGISNTLDLAWKEGRWYVRLRPGIDQVARRVMQQVQSFKEKAKLDSPISSEVDLLPVALHGFIDPGLRTVIEPRFADAGRFSEGLAPVRLIFNWGYIDHSGQLKIPARFTEAQAFEGGFAWVKLPGAKSDRYALIDHEAKVVIEPTFTEVKPFSEGVAAVRRGAKWGYVDPTGQWRIKPRYSSAYSFQNGYADVYCPKQGYLTIDRTGRPVFTGPDSDEVDPG